MLQDLKLYAKQVAGRITREVTGPHAVAILTETAHGLFLVGTEDFTVGRRLRVNGEYGGDELRRLQAIVAPDDEVLIVGAHVGTIAIPLAQQVSRVVAVEAAPSTCRLLDMNVQLNGATNVDVLNVAASDSDAPLQFLSGRANTGGNKRLPVRMARRYTFDKPDIIEVPGARLDDLLSGQQFDLIMLDIEGSEVFALNGMERLLSTAHTLIVEFVPHHLSDVAGVTVGDFVAVIAQAFSSMEIPSRSQIVCRDDFTRVLDGMFRAGESEDGLIFRK